MNKLAIVIPAYKAKYFSSTLQSISNQTSLDFTLYIGDDASPENLHEIITEYKDKINIVYKRFDVNLGSQNLIKHWKRCIDMTAGEEWIWLFSDDDIMEPNCVEQFYSVLHENNDLFHFNLKVIDSESKILTVCLPFPDNLPVYEFFRLRIEGRIYSTVVEYIFKKSSYDFWCGFEDFDLAWNSDDATWIKFGSRRGIRSIPNAFVQWRYSGDNISSRNDTKEIVERKIYSSIKYISWATKFFSNNRISENISDFKKIRWFIGVQKYYNVSFGRRVIFLLKYLDAQNIIKYLPQSVVYLIGSQIKK